MSDAITPQPWWAGALAAILFTIRWLIGFGGRSAAETIKSQATEIKRLADQIERLDQRQQVAERRIEELQLENSRLRRQIGPALPGLDF